MDEVRGDLGPREFQAEVEELQHKVPRGKVAPPPRVVAAFVVAAVLVVVVAVAHTVVRLGGRLCQEIKNCR